MSRSDIPFNADDAHAFLPWIIGIMVCMATLLLCLGLTLNGWVVDRHYNYSNSFTVNIPAGTDEPNAKITKIRDVVQQLPGVTGVAQMSESKLRELLKPWMGSGDASASLPLPTVLDITIDGTSYINYKELQSRLSSIAPGTEVDGHERWIGNFSDFAATLQYLITTLAALIIGGLALIIAFTSRASLRLHNKTVQLLHSIGAEDRYITRQFQQEAFRLTLRGTVPGALAAGTAYWAAGFYMAALQSSMLPSLNMGLAHLELLFIMPLACSTVAWLAARMSVLKQLRHAL